MQKLFWDAATLREDVLALTWLLRACRVLVSAKGAPGSDERAV